MGIRVRCARRFVGPLGAAVATMFIALPAANADNGSYLAAAHADPALAGLSDFALTIGGAKACSGDRNSAPGLPAVSEAVYRIAHQELCP
jgi:hypothetical protein